MLGIDFKSLLAPFLYVVIVFGGLYVFSTLYKRYYASTHTVPKRIRCFHGLYATLQIK